MASHKEKSMTITQTELIKICERFLSDDLSKEELMQFAKTVMFDEENKYECEDELVEEILSQWDDVHLQHKINKTSIENLKNALEKLN